MKGTIGILSVGAGDTTLKFDNKDPVELERAKRIVQDMLKRGYAILVQVGEKDGEPIYRRAKAFDPDTCEYLIAGAPPDEPEQPQEARAAKNGKPKIRGKGHPRNGDEKYLERVPAHATRAVAVGRTAGG